MVDLFLLIILEDSSSKEADSSEIEMKNVVEVEEKHHTSLNGKPPEPATREETPTRADSPEEEIDIDLNDPEVHKAAETIQTSFRKRLSSRTSEAQINNQEPIKSEQPETSTTGGLDKPPLERRDSSQQVDMNEVAREEFLSEIRDVAKGNLSFKMNLKCYV